MFYAIYRLDKANSEKLRAKTRPTHMEYIDDSNTVKLCGPLLTEDGAGLVGSMLVIEADSLSAAQAWADGDPYALADLLQTVHIHPWKWAIDNHARAQNPAS